MIEQRWSKIRLSRAPITAALAVAIAFGVGLMGCQATASTPAPASPAPEAPKAPKAPKADEAPKADDPAPALAPKPAQKSADPEGRSAAEAKVKAALKKRSPDAKVEVASIDGPEGLVIVRARDPKAYPGTGVAALILDPKTTKTYGAHGDLPLAALFSERGWLGPKRPADAPVIRLVHEAQYSGLLILDRPGCAVEFTGGALTIRLATKTMRGTPGPERVVILDARTK